MGSEAEVTFHVLRVDDTDEHPLYTVTCPLDHSTPQPCTQWWKCGCPADYPADGVETRPSLKGGRHMWLQSDFAGWARPGTRCLVAEYDDLASAVEYLPHRPSPGDHSVTWCGDHHDGVELGYVDAS